MENTGTIKETQDEETKIKETANHHFDEANKNEEKQEGNENTPTVKCKEADQPPCKDTQKTVTISDTRVEISDTEDEYEDPKLNSNPRITISEPVISPSEKQPEPRGRCPIYFGIKSYVHDFYQPPDKELLKSGEYIQEDDFQFLVEPGRRRRKDYWLRTGLWLGVNLIVLGIIAMLVGHFTPARQTIVGHQGNYDILDRWAVAFNNRLVICQLAGLAGFTSGAVLVMLVLLVSSYQQEQARAYYVMAATVVPETFVGTPLAGPRQGWSSTHRIPLTGSVRGVQPTFLHNN